MPNELQRALFEEVTNASLKGYTANLGENGYQQAAHAWLMSARDTLTALAHVAREGLWVSDVNRDTVLMVMMGCMARLPDETLWWLGDWTCLNVLMSPDAMRSDDYLEKLKTFATLDEGL